MSAQIVKKNKTSVRGNVAYIFDGLVLFRLEKTKAMGIFILKERLYCLKIKE